MMWISCPPINHAFQWLAFGVTAMLAFAGAIETLQKGLTGIAAQRNWFVERYDKPILDAFEDAARRANIQYEGQHIFFNSIPTAEVAKDAKRSEKSVRKTLLRLEHRGKVYEGKGGWNIGIRPER